MDAEFRVRDKRVHRSLKTELAFTRNHNEGTSGLIFIFVMDWPTEPRRASEIAAGRPGSTAPWMPWPGQPGCSGRATGNHGALAGSLCQRNMDAYAPPVQSRFPSVLQTI